MIRKTRCKSAFPLAMLVFATMAFRGDAVHGQTGSQAEPRPGSRTIDLPTGKQLVEPVPGSPVRLNSLPMTIAVSPDGRYLATVNAGYGTFESKYQQSIAVFDTRTGEVTDFPEPRTAPGMPQTLSSGLAFGSDGAHLYASFNSLTQPTGDLRGHTGNAIAVYGFSNGRLMPEKLLPVAPQRLAAGKKQNNIGAPLPAGMAIPAPAGIAVRRGENGADELLIADNFSDDVLRMDAGTGKVLARFDLSQGALVPSTYPVAITLNRTGTLAFVALWNGSAVAELNLKTGRVLKTLPLLPPSQKTAPSSHPAAFAWSPDGRTLYVALANRDAVAALRVTGGDLRLAATYDARLPGQSYFGAMPDAVAVSADGTRLYAANTGSDAVAVFDTRAPRRAGEIPALGFLPTEWYPTALAVHAGRLYVATDKGQGTGPNNGPQKIVADQHGRTGSFTYIGTLLHGSIAAIDLEEAQSRLGQLTSTVIETNRMKAVQSSIAFKTGGNPIKHVIYIIKENRSYDQVLGDLGTGNADPSLTMYGEEITPNEHKLARQFGVLDNFYDSGEVSGDGHVWSNAAISTDYTEKTWQQSYRGRERPYDYEGVVESGFPIQEGIPDVNEPESGYLWTNLARHNKSLYHFGEFISTKFCDGSGDSPMPKASRHSRQNSPTEGTPEPAPVLCSGGSAIHPGDPIPANYGGGVSRYPWAIPLISSNTATKPELVGHFDPRYPDFNLSFPDQLRVEEFLSHFRQWVAQRQQGADTMPQFIQLRLPNDHTAGTRPGMPTPRASVADNDLAVGRAVEAISHSPYWEDTAFFILEDDAQNGADHVDAHRSIALVISKYSPRREQPVVDSSFYTTVSVVRTMEELLGVPPMNNNDAFAPAITSLFAGEGDQPAYDADYRNRDNGLLYQANKATAPGARESSRMNFEHEDRADPRVLNVILWRDAMGAKPLPPMLAHPAARSKGRREDDDDDGN
ncbi:MAG TPA: bifunctional YncE family protein/alkaline phosphatase family protein [Acidobacteriaceae bacterium]|nr:bifunctional YncE family protein/alkaline phosphatase family protein [Acidobacteriaceae bacterium]